MKGKMRSRHLSLWVTKLPKLSPEQRAGDHPSEGDVAWNDDPVVNPEFQALEPSGVQAKAADEGRDGDEAAAEGTQPIG